MIEFDEKTKERIKTLKQRVEEHHKEYVEKYKHIKCSYQGCKLWSQCQRCSGLYDTHEDCGWSWTMGWRQAVSEHTGNVSPY